MNNTFKVGELVVMQFASYFHEYNGTPAVVIGGLQTRGVIDLNTMEDDVYDGYRVRILAGDGQIVTAKPHQLRKLQDKQADDKRARTHKRPDKEEKSRELTTIEKVSRLNSKRIKIVKEPVSLIMTLDDPDTNDTGAVYRITEKNEE